MIVHDAELRICRCSSSFQGACEQKQPRQPGSRLNVSHIALHAAQGYSGGVCTSWSEQNCCNASYLGRVSESGARAVRFIADECIWYRTSHCKGCENHLLLRKSTGSGETRGATVTTHAHARHQASSAPRQRTVSEYSRNDRFTPSEAVSACIECMATPPDRQPSCTRMPYVSCWSQNERCSHCQRTRVIV